MEYSKRYKNEQGAELEIKLKAECATVGDIDEAFRLISVGSHYFYQEMVKTWGAIGRLDVESLIFFSTQMKTMAAYLPSGKRKLVEIACDLLSEQVVEASGEWAEAFRRTGEQETGGSKESVRGVPAEDAKEALTLSEKGFGELMDNWLKKNKRVAFAENNTLQPDTISGFRHAGGAPGPEISIPCPPKKRKMRNTSPGVWIPGPPKRSRRYEDE